MMYHLAKFKDEIYSVLHDFDVRWDQDNDQLCWISRKENADQTFRSIKDTIQELRIAQTLWLDCTNKADENLLAEDISLRLHQVFQQAHERPSVLEHGDSERIIATCLQEGLVIHELVDHLLSFADTIKPLAILLKTFRDGRQDNITPEMRDIIHSALEARIFWIVATVKKPRTGRSATQQAGTENHHSGQRLMAPPPIDDLFRYLNKHPKGTKYKDDPRVKIVKAIQSRRGQQEFRARLLGQFQGQCCITGCSAEEVLEAAHISPYSMNQDMGLSNGLILRADLHTLFDCGLLAIDTERKQVLLAPRLQKSVDYGALKGHQVFLPDEPADDAAKRKAALDRHREERKREW